jgi:hypothetical protein
MPYLERLELLVKEVVPSQGDCAIYYQEPADMQDESQIVSHFSLFHVRDMFRKLIVLSCRLSSLMKWRNEAFLNGTLKLSAYFETLLLSDLNPSPNIGRFSIGVFLL